MLKGNIRHSACYWVYQPYFTLEQFCIRGKEIGLTAIDLVGPDGWQTLVKHDLDCAMANGAELSLDAGFNQPEYHGQLVKNYLDLIPRLAACGFKNIICFSGLRNGISDSLGLENCAFGISKILPTASRYGVTVSMELLNSKVDHPGYQCDHTAWGIELCRKLDSDNFKLLYDIYHMQIMEGDLVRTILENSRNISHYHTGGVPGRHEINDSQEINYPAIMQAIVSTGFEGYVAQEFIPAEEDKIASLQSGVLICDV